MELIFPEDICTRKHACAVNDATMRQIIMTHPSVVVDVGAGDGFYGKLVKRLLPGAICIGVEPTQSYIEVWQLTSIYTFCLNHDIRNAIDCLSGDLIIFGDILEHLDKTDAMAVLKSAVERFHFVLVNGPVGVQPQTDENPWELHRCEITKADFVPYNILEYHEFDNGIMNCLLLGRTGNF